MAKDQKKYLDQTGAKELFRAVLNRYESKVTGAEADIDALQALHATGKTVAQEVSDGISALNLSTTYAGKSYEGKVDTLIGSDTGKSVRTVANEELAAQLIPANAQEALDTLQEIAAWIQAHPGDASAMNDAITALKGLHAAGATEGSKKTVAEEVNAGINALDLANTYYGKSAGEANASAINTLNGADTVTGSIAQKIKTAIEGLDATASQTAGADGLALSIAEADGKITGISGSIAAGTYDTYGAASTALSTAIGTSSDAASADTINGAKAYAAVAADEVYTALVAMTSTEIATQVATAVSEYQAAQNSN